MKYTIDMLESFVKWIGKTYLFYSAFYKVKMGNALWLKKVFDCALFYFVAEYLRRFQLSANKTDESWSRGIKFG